MEADDILRSLIIAVTDVLLLDALTLLEPIEMFQKKDEAHLKAMSEIQELMQKPDAMKAWIENKKKEFDELPDD